MRILITTDLYLPSVNGVVTSVLALAGGLRRRGHEVRILTLSNTTRTYTAGDVTYIGSVSAGFVYPGVRLRVAPLRRTIREFVLWRPDVVHSQCEFSTFRIARAIARKCGAPLLHTYHTVYEDYTHYFCPIPRVGRALARWLTRRVADRTDGVVAPTDKVRGLLTSYGVTAPITVIPTGLEFGAGRAEPEPDEKARLRRAYGLPEGGHILLYLGRLAEEKHITALFSLLERGDLCDAFLVLAGDGPYRRTLEGEVRRRGLSERVRFLGMIPHTEVDRCYRMADVFVNASESETQGLTYLEAMAAGLPVVCRADPSVTGLVIRGETGYACDGVADMAVAARRLLTDGALRAKIVAAARRKADAYSADAFAAAAERLYLRTTPKEKPCVGENIRRQRRTI